jgi:hypothetical protein
VAVGAFLVVLQPGLGPETLAATLAAACQLRGVAGVRTLYSDVGAEIAGIREVRDEVRREVLDRARQAGGA